MELRSGDEFLLRLGTTDEGVVTTPDALVSYGACVRLGALGLLAEAEVFGRQLIYRTTLAGLAAIGKVIH